MLVVDDDPFVLASFRRRSEGSYTTLTASDAATAHELARERPPDLAIIDLRLGRESGIDVMRSLKAVHPNTIMVLISGWATIDNTVLAVRAGADYVLAKPVTFAEIMARVSANGRPQEHEETPTLERAEWEHISRVLTDCSGNLSLAARRLGVYRSTLRRRLRKYPPRS